MIATGATLRAGIDGASQDTPRRSRSPRVAASSRWCSPSAVTARRWKWRAPRSRGAKIPDRSAGRWNGQPARARPRDSDVKWSAPCRRCSLAARSSASISGVIRGHRFAVAAGVGIDAAMVEETPRWMKRRLGVLAYTIIATRAALRAVLRRKFFLARVHVDGAADRTSCGGRALRQLRRDPREPDRLRTGHPGETTECSTAASSRPRTSPRRDADHVAACCADDFRHGSVACFTRRVGTSGSRRRRRCPGRRMVS